MRLLLVAIALGLTGCAAAPWPNASQDVERISYELTNLSFCGECDGTTIIVDAAGRVRIERRSWQTQGSPQRRLVAVAPERFKAFRAALSPYRPASSRTIEDVQCGNYVLHGSEVRVTWKDAHGEVSRVFLLGCSNEEAINAAVVAAPASLGLGQDARLW